MQRQQLADGLWCEAGVRLDRSERPEADPSPTSAHPLAKSKATGQGHLLSRWRHAVPKFVKIPGVEEGDCFDDLRVPHLQIPRISIVIGFAVPHGGCGIEQDDDRIAISVEAADSWNQRRRHAGIKRIDYVVEEFLLAVISLRQAR
jgi:hypothetical protein